MPDVLPDMLTIKAVNAELTICALSGGVGVVPFLVLEHTVAQRQRQV